MKKLLILVVCALFILSGCDRADEKQYFGAGIYAAVPSATNATDDADGTGKIDVTVAAVTVDKNGKISSCQLDSITCSVKYTSNGKAVEGSGFKTKYELGESYNMVAYGGAQKEWFEQADAFERVVTGKSIDEVKALVAENNKGNDEVVSAGCTIAINDFVGAIEKAYSSADTDIDSEYSLKVNMVTDQTYTDASEEKDGANKVTVNIFVGAFDTNEKVLAAKSDCVELSFTFDQNGASTLDTTKKVVSKREMGYSYGMMAYGGAQKEWFEQADAFDNEIIGKTKQGIASLEDKSTPASDSLQAAGCTIDVSPLIKAAIK